MSSENAISDYLVVCSVDGTLLEAGYGIPRSNIDAIEQFLNRGGRFTFCTGRNSESVSKFIEWTPISDPAVLCNGSFIFDFNIGKALYSQPLKETITDVVAEVMDLFPHIGVEITVEPSVFVARMNEQLQQRTSIQHLSYVLCSLEDVRGNWNKVVFTGSSEELAPLEQYVQSKYKEGNQFSDFQYLRHDAESLEIISRGVHKGTGLRMLCDYLSIPKERVIAVGSSFSDIEMFSASGIRICVGNAPAELRYKMDLTVSSCLRGGIADVLNRFDDIVGNYKQLTLDTL